MEAKTTETYIDDLKNELTIVNSLIAEQDIKVAKTKSSNNIKASRERAKLRDLEIRASKIRNDLNKQLLVAQSKSLMAKFDAITEKNDCLRVRFYDWLANKLEKLATRIRDHAMKISKPCVVKLPPKPEKYLIDKHGNYIGRLPLLGKPK